MQIFAACISNAVSSFSIPLHTVKVAATEIFLVMEDTAMAFQPHPFHWAPAAGRRHASVDPYPPGCSIYPDGVEITTLCGETVTSARGELAWLWETCPGCDQAVRKLLGIAWRSAVLEETAARP
ncbi:zinc finger protein [Saccharopolyspora tripterygii]